MRTLRRRNSYFAPANNYGDRGTALLLLALLASVLIHAQISEAQICSNTLTSINSDSGREVAAGDANSAAAPDKPEAVVEKSKGEKKSPLPDFNRRVFYRNKLEASLDVGWLPINIPFPFDVFEGDPYDLYPIRYTLVPVIASVRWQLGNIWGPPVLRGNWDLTFSGSATAIPRGPETHYFSYDMGLRRNFTPRNWRVTPYWDVRAGVGYINAKGPLGVYYAQGQNFTFNINMGAGVRYNFSPRYGISAGLNWMHISNGNLSSPQYSNYGINVYGPMFGLDVALRPHSRASE